MKSFRLFLLFFILFIASIFEMQANHFESDQVDVNIAYTQLPEKDGEVYIAVTFKPKKSWHLYWENPGDIGMAPKIEFYLPSHAKSRFFGFPAPLLFKNGSFTTYGYNKSFTLVYQINLQEKVEPGDIKLDINWLSCKEQCIPQNFVTTLDNKEIITLKEAQVYVDNLPQHIFQGKIIKQDQQIIFQIPAQVDNEINDAYFFPKYQSQIKTDEKQKINHIKTKKSNFQLEVKTTEIPNHVEGLLLIKSNNKETFFIIDKDIEADEIKQTETVLMLFILSLIGGLFLNLMPCVFPVLSLKIMNIIKHVETKKGLARHGLAYAAGIFITFMTLFLIVTILKGAGYSIGWGFQLQSPIFITALIFLFSVLFMNSFGVFEFQGIQTNSSISKMNPSHAFTSFLNGILTTVVSTPCTAPFMGSAIAVALSQTYIESFIIFFGLSLGLSLPFLCIAFCPKVLNIFPKPGEWMNVIKQLLAFPMLGAIVWLIWILESLKPTIIIPVLVALSAISFIFWVYGSMQSHSKNLFGPSILIFLPMAIFVLSDSTSYILNSIFYISTVLSLAVFSYAALIGIKNQTWQCLKKSIVSLLFSFLIAFGFLPLLNAFNDNLDIKTPIAYSEEIVLDAQKKGQPIFINYTARWCMTCQINKASVLNSKVIQDAFEKNNVLYLEADWTTHSPMITKSLQNYGRESIPVYVLLIPGKNDPILLPELLTEKIVLKELDRIKK